MRTKILTFILMAGTVVGCASNPPPPPPMAAAPPPPPPPAPMVMGPFDGMYRGTPTLADGAPASCPKMTRPVSVRVLKNNTFVMNGVRGTIAPDGTISSPARGRMTIGGMASNGTLNLTSTRGPCTYMTALTKP